MKAWANLRASTKAVTGMTIFGVTVNKYGGNKFCEKNTG